MLPRRLQVFGGQSPIRISLQLQAPRTEPTSTVNVWQFTSHAVRPEGTPIRHQKDAARMSAHLLPVMRPARTLKGGHKRRPLDFALRRGLLELVDERHDLVDMPLAGGHVEGEEEDEMPIAGRGSGCVGMVQLRVGVVVRGADVEGEAVYAAGLGGEDLSCPLVRGLPVCQADLG